jgi:hypothetical protein
LPILVSILHPCEHRDCAVNIGGYRDDVIIAELDQCVPLGISLSDAANPRRVDNDRRASPQFGELMELNVHDLSP